MKVHSGICELQHKVNEQARRRIDHKAIARRSYQVAQEQKSGFVRRSVGRTGKFASDIGYDFAAAIVLLAVISLGAWLMGDVMSAKASFGDPIEIFQQPEDPRSEAPKSGVPDIDNGDGNDDPVIEVEDPGKVPGQPAPVPAPSRASLGLPLTDDESVPGRDYLFASNGDDRDDPLVRRVPDIGPGDDNDSPTVVHDPGRVPGVPAPVPAVTRSDLGLPLDDDAPGRWYLFAGHGDDRDAPTVE